MGIQAIRGFRDVLPADAEVWQWVEETARRVFRAYGFSEIRIPLLEKTELFARSIGESTDIVEKEMYTFSDRSGESITLRPEATAGILRAYIEHSLHQVDPVQKLYCFGPMFRHERPQKGRHRQFHQIDAEILGSADPRTDAELLAMLRAFFVELGLRELDFQVNSLGCPVCRPAFRDAVVAFLRGKEALLCPDCQRRLGVNPLRIYDCKVERCADIIRSAPRIVELLCPACREHLDGVSGHLSMVGMPHAINPMIVRGLDYYTRTTFEVISQDLGAQNAVCGGGRYDQLIRDLGGPDLPGIGFAIGEDRLVSILQQKGLRRDRRVDLFVAALGEKAAQAAFLWVERARGLRLAAEMDFRGGSLKAQLRRADKLGSRRLLILGESELGSGKAQLKEMDSGAQSEVILADLGDLMARWRGE
jgi:histidyl-tRNA synthetase